MPRAAPLTIQLSQEDLARIGRASRLFGVSKNYVIAQILAERLARAAGQPLSPEQQRLVDTIVAAAVAPPPEESP